MSDAPQCPEGCGLHLEICQVSGDVIREDRRCLGCAGPRPFESPDETEAEEEADNTKRQLADWEEWAAGVKE